MIRNKTNSTIVLEWMGKRKELAAGWSANLDPESESYLLLKYPDVLEGDIKENVVLKLVKKTSKTPSAKRKSKRSKK